MTAHHIEEQYCMTRAETVRRDQKEMMILDCAFSDGTLSSCRVVDPGDREEWEYPSPICTSSCDLEKIFRPLSN